MIVSAAMGGALAEPVAGLFPTPHDRIRIGAADVDHMRMLRTQANDFERLAGGGAISGAAMIRQFRSGLDALHGVYRNESVRQDMHQAVAHFGIIASWIMVEHGEHGTAQRAFAAALAAAEGAAPDRRDGLRALILTSMARQAVYQQHHRSALALLDYLDSALPALPADVRAIVRTRRARALAGLGDVHAVDELARRATDEFGSSDQTSAAEYHANGFGLGELTSDLGHAFSSLAVEHGLRGAEAERRLAESIASYGLDDARSRALAGLRLVTVHLAQRDGQRALAVAQAHAADATLIRSHQLHRTAETGLALAVRHRADPGTAEVIDILRAIRRPVSRPVQPA